MKLLFKYIGAHKKYVLLALLLAAINQCFSLMDPLIAGKMMDEFGLNANHYRQQPFAVFAKALLLLLMASMGVAMVSRIAKNFQDYFTSVVIQRTGAAMYTDGIKHALQLPFQVFEDQRSGETLQKLIKVRTDSEKLIGAFISIVFQTLIGLLFVTWYSFTLHWAIAPALLLTVPALAMVSSALSKRIKIVSKKILGETTNLAGSTTESLRNIELVKSLGLAPQEIKRLNSTTNKILGLELNKVKYIRSLSFVQGTTVNFLRTCFVFLLYYLVFQDVITPGKLLTLMFYSFFIFGPLQEMGNVIAIYRETQASLQNFEDLMAMPVDYKPTNPKTLTTLNSIEFSEVSFKHQQNFGYAVHQISFTAFKGQTVAFVGPSGAGKSTLVKLLVGLYQPQNGKILYNNINQQDLNIQDLQNNLGFVTQDTQLFAGSIKENLRFVNPEATDQQITDALNNASCQHLLARAGNGIESIIGEGGIKLSGGEKQRLSIARALLRSPQLLILDEATSSLDSITEQDITDTVKQINQTHQHITIMIAHRLSTIMHADEIFVLEKGSVAEHGTHQQLLQSKGLYYAMWRQQIGERKHNV